MNQFNIPIEITPSHLWTIFSLVIIFFTITVSILMHHWSYYGIKGNRKVFVKSLFFFGSIVMIIAMIVAIILYNLTTV
jgi:hypothetical protein